MYIQQSILSESPGFKTNKNEKIISKVNNNMIKIKCFIYSN